jgi:hypothetical protein
MIYIINFGYFFIADIEKDEIDSIPQYIVFIAIPGI